MSEILIDTCIGCQDILGCTGYFSKVKEKCKDCLNSKRCDIKRKPWNYNHYLIISRDFCEECEKNFH